MLPGILNQLGAENLANLKKLANIPVSGADTNKAKTEDIDIDDEVPGKFVC